MRNNQEQIVIKRANKKKEEGHSAGAWKVAFADFTLAMMAFFMVLWIISSSSEQELKTAAKTIRDYSIFDGTPNPFKFKGEGTPMDLKLPSKDLETTVSSMLSGADSKQAFRDIIKEIGGENAPLVAAKEIIEEMARQLDAEDNLSIEIVPQGLRIRLHDNEDRQMFRSGSANMSPFFEDLLVAIAPVFREIDNNLVVSGHTDSVPFNRQLYTNWELSGERAMTARQVLKIGGMPDDRLLQVSGMGARFPADKADTEASVNRRIELLVLNRQAENQLRAIFNGDPRMTKPSIVGDMDNAKGAIEEARIKAEANRPVTR